MWGLGSDPTIIKFTCISGGQVWSRQAGTPLSSWLLKPALTLWSLSSGAGRGKEELKSVTSFLITNYSSYTAGLVSTWKPVAFGISSLCLALGDKVRSLY